MPINNKQQEIDLIFHMVIYSLNVISWLWIQSNQILAFETSIVVEFDANRDVCHLSLLFNKYSTSIVFFFFCQDEQMIVILIYKSSYVILTKTL